MKKLILLLLFFGSQNALFAQDLKGKILNAETFEEIGNANILNHNSEIIAVSDQNGNFSVNQTGDLPIKISALGFQELETVIKASTERKKFYLAPISENLSQVLIRSAAIPNRLQQVAASVNLVSDNEFKRGDNLNLVESFDFVPGVFVNQGALNTNKINIRGIGARSQYSTNRIQSYFDGIPLTTAEGELTLDDIDPETLERVEVIKGPNSSIYGAGLGGSVNLYSAVPEYEKISASVKSQYGSFSTHKNVVQASHSTENSALQANLTKLRSDGFRDNGDYYRESALITSRITTSEENSLSILANFTKLKAYIPSSLNEEDFLQQPQNADAGWRNSRGYESYDRGLLGGSYQHYFSENFSNTTSLYLNFRNGYEPRPFDILKEERLSGGARTRFNLDTEVLGKSSRFSFGAEYYHEWYEMGTFENLYQEFENRGSVRGARLSGNGQNRDYRNIFAQMNLQLTQKWSLEAGFNFNHTRYSLSDLFYEDEIDQSGDYGFDPVLSPRLGSSFEISEGKNVYASVSHGFSTPTVAETLTPEGQINTSLKPETGYNYEAGFKGNWLGNKLYTEITAFSIQIENLLVAQRVAEDRYVGINAGKTDHNGVEMLFAYNWQPVERIVVKPYLNAAFNFFKFDEFIDQDQDYSGKDLPGVPQSTLTAGIDLVTPWGLELLGSLRAVGEIPLDDANTGATENYELLDLKASYRAEILKDLQVNFFAGINNVLDEHYAASVLTNAVGFGGAAPRYFYPGPPRNYFGGIQLAYSF